MDCRGAPCTRSKCSRYDDQDPDHQNCRSYMTPEANCTRGYKPAKEEKVKAKAACTRSKCDDYNAKDSDKQNCGRYARPDEPGGCGNYKPAKEADVSIHGACHDYQECGRECDAFQDGDCSIEDEIKERFPSCHDCGHQSAIRWGCDHPQGKNKVDVEEHYNSETAPLWCPIVKNNLEAAQPTQTTGENDMTEKKFDFDKSTAQVKDNAMASFTTAKDVIIQLQQGKVVISAVKAGLRKAPGTPDSLKLLLETAYGDMVIGLLLHTMAPVLTGSPLVIKAVKAANIAGAVEVSQQFTFIQDAVEAAIAQVPGLEDLKRMVEPTDSGHLQDDMTVRCAKCDNTFTMEYMASESDLCKTCFEMTAPEDR